MGNTVCMTTQKNTAKTVAKETLAWTGVLSFVLAFCFTLGRFDFFDDPQLFQLSTIFTYVAAAFGLALFATLHYHIAYSPYFAKARYGTYAYAGVVLYTLSSLVCFLGFCVVNASVFKTATWVWQMATHAAWAVLIFGVPFVVLYTALQEARRALARRKEIEAASRNTSMLLLAKKLEPHFLFNSLNAIYAIAQQEAASATIEAIDSISEKLRDLLDAKPVAENETIKVRKVNSFRYQFLFVWLGILVFMTGTSAVSYLSTGEWEREPMRFWIYQPALIALVAFTITGHYYLLYRPSVVIAKRYRRYFSLLFLFALGMVALDVAVNYFLIEVVKIFGGDDETIGRYILVALARVLTAEAVCAWVYATVSHYRYYRRQRDAALRQQQQDEQRLQQTQVDTEALFALLRELEEAVNTDEAPRTKGAVTELVSLFRYSAVHAGDTTIPVEQEFEFLRRYIHLQKMRIRQGAGVRISTVIESGGDNAVIAPMLLLPYVENAFKYGISYAAESFIDINILVKNEELSCNIINTDHSALKSGRPSAGMGLADTLKRLQLQYEGKFTLKSGAADGLFTVALHLKLR